MKYSGVILLALAVLSFSDSPANAVAEPQPGVATTYRVTVKKVELCATGSAAGSASAAPTCVSPLIIGSGSSTFDIAGVTPNTAVGDFATISEWPSGGTYTRVRVTLSRTFSIAGNVTGAINCRTNSVAGNAGTDHAPGTGTYMDDDSLGTVQTLVLPPVDGYGVGSPSNEENYWPAGIEILNGDFSFNVALPTPITTGGTAPNIRLSFDTQEGLLGLRTGETNCRMYPNHPIVHYSIE